MQFTDKEPKAGAIVLAAGRGERMRPLTDTCPKPLLRVRGRPLLQWHLDALARVGQAQVVVNTAWLGDQIEATIGAQVNKSLQIHYSHEGRDFGAALETAGGIARALPYLDDIFWVLAGDVYAPQFEFSPHALERFRASDALAHIWLVPNPAHNPKGDFGLSGDGVLLNQAQEQFTYSTIGLYRSALFAQPWCDIAAGNLLGVKRALVPLMRAAISQGRMTGEIYDGPWTDVGTPVRLAQLNQPD